MISRALVLSAVALGGLTAACGSGAATSQSPSAAAGSGSTTTTGSAAGISPTATTPPSAPATRTAATTSTSPPTAKSPPALTTLSPVPRAGAEPTVRFPKNSPASGRGAHAQVSGIPDGVWNKMVGYSWTPGCPVGRSSLRYVTVNFWGFDGKRSRGAVVVHRSIASATARAFTALYEQQFRIRQMRPMDSSWGKNPKGPGADDYAAMEADNTSAFNCRYVGGQEAKKVYSNHAYGKAVDINDFENPYVDDSGKVYPSSYFLHRRGKAPGVFAGSSSAAVRAFTSRGFSWGGRWSHPDYQHFDG